METLNAQASALSTVMYSADEVAAILHVSKSKAYQLIKAWNKELEAANKFTLRVELTAVTLKRNLNCNRLSEIVFESCKRNRDAYFIGVFLNRYKH